MTSVAEFPRLAAAVVNMTTSRVVRLDAVASMEIHRLNETRSNVTFRYASGGQETFLQRHRPPRSAGPNRTNLLLRPGQMPRIVQVGTPSTVGWYGVRIMAPPNSTNVTTDPGLARVQSFADLIGMPPVGSPSDKHLHTEWRDFEGSIPSSLYRGLSGCIWEGSGECTQEAIFRLDCPNCTTWSAWIRPDAGDELTASVDGRVTVHSGGTKAVAVFTEEGALVYGRASVAVDINTSAVVSPTEARNRTLAVLDQQGYRLSPQVPGQNMSEARFDVLMASDAVRARGAEYHWSTQIRNKTAPDDKIYNADIFQDAVSGRVLRIELGPNAVHECPADGCIDWPPNTTDDGNATTGPNSTSDGPGDEPAVPNPTPGPGVAVVVGLVVALAVWGRRGS